MKRPLAEGNQRQAPNESGDAVRAWRAPRNGEIMIDAAGDIVVQNNGGSADGVRIKFLWNNTQIWPLVGCI